MAGLARRLAPAAALGGLAVVIVGVADPALAGHTTSTATGASEPVSAGVAPRAQAAPQAPAQPAPQAQEQAPSQPQEQSAPQGDPQAQGDAQASGDCANGQSVTGQTAMTRWGPVQVSATVSGGQICEVHAVAWPSSDGRSQMINAYAIPQLDAMATQSHGTQIDYVSGATYTSDGYAQSLQSILDSL